MSERITSLDEVKDPEAFLAAYYKAMDEAKDFREENKTLRAQVEDGGMEEEVGKWKSRALKAEAKTTLEAQGIKNPDRILKYLNLEGVDFDKDGNLTGLDDKVKEVKTDFPELFDTKRRAGSNSADIHANDAVEAEIDPFKAQVEAALSK